MADQANERPDRDQPAHERLRDAPLPDLVSRMLQDLLRIAEAQARFFGVNLEATMIGAVDRAVGQLIAAIIYVEAVLCLLAALVVLLHTWLLWWQALAIAGCMMIVAGWIVQRATTRLASKRVDSAGQTSN